MWWLMHSSTVAILALAVKLEQNHKPHPPTPLASFLGLAFGVLAPELFMEAAHASHKVQGNWKLYILLFAVR